MLECLQHSVWLVNPPTKRDRTEDQIEDEESDEDTNDDEEERE